MAATCIVILIIFLAIAASKDHHEDDISIEVFGGKDAKPGQFPFIGSLRYAFFDNHGCGATLISNDTAVTAAHCFPDENSENVLNLAVFGDLKLYETTSSHHHSSFTAITHPQFDKVILLNDIALIYLKNPIWEILGKNISSIPLASSSDEMSDYFNCYVIGWGLTTATDIYPSNVLQFSPLNLYNHTECDNIFGYSPEATTLCAGSPITDACVGDSGGPLVCYRNDNPDIIELVGVVSYGIDVCSAGTPGVYTRVSAYRDWIQSRPQPKPNHATTQIIPLYFVMLMIYISFYGYKY